MAIDIAPSIPARTAADLIKAAAIKLGAIATGESLSADEANDSLNVLNSMLDFWRNDSFLVYQIAQNGYTWGANNRTRTIGSGADFNAERPVRIEDGTFFRDANNIDYPVTIIRDRVAYDTQVLKSNQSTYPDCLYYDPSYPNGTIYVYPVPSQALTLYLNSWQLLHRFASLGESLSMPPGYQWVIEHNLAVYLEPVFSLAAPDSVRAEAIRSKRELARTNHRPVYACTDVSTVIGNESYGNNIYNGP